MVSIRKVILACVVFGLGMASLAQPVSAQTTSRDYRLSLPYVWWTYQRTFTTLESDLKVVADPGAGTDWFMAHQFALADSAGAHKGVGYIGLQSTTTVVGQKGVMFSVWNATTATAGTGATCQPFGGEGVGMQCFKAFNWVAGRSYRLRVVNDRGLSYSGYIVDMSSATPTVTFLGTIGAPPGIAGFGRESVQWLEHYGNTPATCADYPYLKAHWSRPQADAGAVVADSPSITYGPYYCKNAAVTASGADYLMEGGTPGANLRQNLLTSSNKYVYALPTGDACGGGGLKPDGTAISACSGLSRVALPGGKVALQAENGNFLSCAGGGGSTVSATARAVSNYETFTETIAYGKVSYKSHSGRFLTATSWGAVDFKCSGYFNGSTEKFTAVVNRARSASVTVSNESVSTGQQGIKAIDGAIDGYPNNATREWVANGQGAGAWIQLNWPITTAVKQVILYDRPNLNDQIVSGTLLFSNGTSVKVGTLPNNGAGLAVSFTSRNVSWVRFRIDQATGSTGLAEIEVY